MRSTSWPSWRVAFGRSVQPGQIPRCGIAGISELDVRLAAELGCVVKLIATATFNNDDALAALRRPDAGAKNTPLADVRGSCNALLVAGDLAGETCYSGPGAGANPTASAVFADLIDLALGRSQVGFTAARWWEAPAGTVLLEVTPPCRWYLRLSVDDRPGVLAAMAAALARQHVSIASVVQHAAVVGQSVPVVILTHPASRRPVQDAISEIAALAFLRESVVAMPVN